MPCNCDHLRPDRREMELQKAAQLLVYVRERQRVSAPLWLLEAAGNIYCNDERPTQILCGEIRGMSKEDREAIVYDAHCKSSRELATWWEEHLAADQERVARELVE